MKINWTDINDTSIYGNDKLAAIVKLENNNWHWSIFTKNIHYAGSTISRGMSKMFCENHINKI